MPPLQYVLPIINVIVIINAVAAVITVFRDRRDIAATWAWLLVLIMIPVAGFIAYAFIGRKLPKNRLFRLKKETQIRLEEMIQRQRDELGSELMPADAVTSSVRGMVSLFLNSDGALLSRKNRVKIFTDGHEKFHAMFQDIEAAQKHVHIEYYTFYNDKIGNELLHLLERKAAEGVDVRVLYDPWGSMGTFRSFFKHLEELGGHARPFLGAHSAILDFRLNFRDHRKIVVTDGRVGYVGGFNVGDQYLGRDKKFGYWRDTHLRIVGSGVFELQERFIRDWNATDAEHRIDPTIEMFPVIKVKGNTSLQIVSSGPDNDGQQIKMGYIKMITTAQHRLWIQSPYLIPDDSVLDAIRIAAMSGVDVRIMVPDKPDHAFVYRATQYYAHELAESGVKIYYYNNGFIHAKTMVIDGQVASVGSANMDFRSFKLNFEVNAFLYDTDLAKELETVFLRDQDLSSLITVQDFENQPFWLKFKQTFSRLLSPIL
ncbi:cardiolipin synthase [Lactiplantibacillus carotarum]|uniref:cardiolipin synthase n=1 Tax=Lactiplantibacillus carotarum TaxID=2993456 RepID=UPI00384B16C2